MSSQDILMAQSSIAQLSGELGRETALKEAQKDRDFNAEQAELARQFSREERLASQEFDLDMWNRNNEYNSPVEQLKRYKAAGINPNAMNGSNPVASSPVKSTPMSGVSASTSSGGALANGLMSFPSSMLNAHTSVHNAIQEDKVRNYRIKEISSNISKNDAEIKKTLSSAGLDNVTAKQIEENTRWIAKLSQSQVEERVARVTNLYNQNKEILQSIDESNKRIDKLGQDINESKQRILESQQNVSESLQDIAESKSRVSVNEQDVKNKEVENSIKTLERDFANEFGMPVNSPEFAFYWKLWKNKQLPQFIDEVTLPLDRVKWKPQDYVSLDYTGGSANSRYHYDFNPRKGVYNPHAGFGQYDPGQRYKDVKEVSKKRAKMEKKTGLKFIDY